MTTSHPASIEEAVALIREYAKPLPSERVSLSESLHRILREAIHAPEDLPPFDRSSMDGYAIDVDDAATTFTVVDHIRAGEWKPRVISRGQAVQIATGAALPGQGLQVVMKEGVQRVGNQVHVLRRSSELNIQFRGEDARKGQLLVEPGLALQPGALALLASLGHTQPRVTRLPRVLHVATGNEIVAPENTPLPGQIRDSNSILVRSFLNQWNIAAEQLRLPEDQQTVESTLSKIEPVDMLLISGGASVGEHDFTRQVFEHLGYTIQISKTNTRPGKPLLFATQKNALAFGLPGNPLAHFVCLNLYIRTALEALSGASQRLATCQGVLSTELDNQSSSRETLWPACVSDLKVTPLHWTSSGDLTPLASANALARIPAGTRRLSSGTPIQFFPIGYD